MYYGTKYSSPLGLLTLACDGDGQNLVGLWLENQKYSSNEISKNLVFSDDIPLLSDVKDWLDHYFARERPKISSLPLAPIGSEFWQGVWQVLCDIPYGKVTTYSDVAKELALRAKKEKVSARAVGGGVGHNPISIIIPCHRVVGKNGNLTGYGGGVDKKIRLMELEGVDLSLFYLPKKGTAL